MLETRKDNTTYLLIYDLGTHTKSANKILSSDLLLGTNVQSHVSYTQIKYVST